MSELSASASALAKARVAFITNTTSSSHAARNAFLGSPPLSSPRWKLKQLSGACELLTTHAEDLVQSLSTEYSYPAGAYYQELALALEDITRHYTNVSRGPENTARRGASSTVKHEDVPVGVSLLLFDTVNPIRFLFGTLAANIVLGNTVVLANLSYGSASLFWDILRRKIPEFLDPEAVIVLETFESAPSVLDMADLTTVIAEQPNSYRNVLDRPKSQFISTAATSIIVVDQGPKSHEQVASDILASFAFRGLRPESANVCFIRERELSSFSGAFSARYKEFGLDDDAGAKASNLLKDFPRLCPGVYSAELSPLLGAAKKHDIRAVFDLAEFSGALLVISYRSVEQVIEALKTLKEPPKYLTFMAPDAKGVGEYFQKWTESEFFSLGHIRPSFPHDIDSETLFPVHLFGKTRISVFGPGTEPLLSLEAALERVHKTVKAPREAPNQTLEFFGYMQRAAMSVGLVIGGVLVSAGYIWYTKRA